MSRRDLLSAAALVALGGISLAATAQAVWFASSTRRDFGRAELIAWLTQRDLSTVPRAIQLRLAKQFEQDFAAGHDWQQELEQMNEEQRTRLMENYAELSETWFLDKVDRYFDLSEPARTEYLDSQIDSISRWPLFQQGEFQNGNLLQAGDLSYRLTPLQDRFLRLPAPERQRVQHFAGAAYLRWMARGFQQLMPLSGGDH